MRKWGIISDGDWRNFQHEERWFECGRCGQGWETGKGKTKVLPAPYANTKRRRKLKDTYRRENQLKASGSDWVDYGVLKRLQQHSGVELPPEWRGTVDDLARDLGMEVEAVAEKWNRSQDKQPRSVDELRSMGTFEISQ